MRKSIIILALFASALTAAPLCNSLSNYGQLIASGGCTIGDLFETNFQFAGSATGTGITPVASQVTFTLDDPSFSSSTGDPIWGFEFDPNISVGGVGSEDVILQYDILAPLPIITSNHLLMTGLTQGLAFASVAEGPDCGKVAVPGPCQFQPILAVTASAPHQDVVFGTAFQFLHVFKDINVTSLTQDGLATISNVRDAVDLAAPEPGTMLIGLGLVLVAVKLRRMTA